MTETKTGRHPGVGLGRPCQCGVWWQARSVTSQPAEETVVLRCCCCPEWEGVASLAGGAPAHSQSLLTATSRCLAAGTSLYTSSLWYFCWLWNYISTWNVIHMEQHLFLIIGNFDLTACVMWSLGRLHNILCSDQDNKQQTDLLSSEYQTQDL